MSTAASHPTLRPVKPPWLRTGVAAAFTVSVLATLWWLAAPTALGGRTTLVTVDGTSMLPTYRGSDIVVLRPASGYRIGEIVGYRSALLHRVVLHRIVGQRDGRYTLKGDNNTYTDPEQPTREQLIGRAVLRLPAAGKVTNRLHRPWLLALLAAAAVVTVGLGNSAPTAKRRA
jgi:signal peptidase I